MVSMVVVVRGRPDAAGRTWACKGTAGQDVPVHSNRIECCCRLRWTRAAARALARFIAELVDEHLGSPRIRADNTEGCGAPPL